MTTKERYDQLKSRNICVKCGVKKAEPNRIKCLMCLMEMRRYSKNRCEINRKMGKCSRCGQEPMHGKIVCAQCFQRDAEKSKEYRRNLMAAGKCVSGCGEPARSGKLHCKKHALQYRISRMKNGGVLDSEIPKIQKAVEEFNGACGICGATEPGGRGEWCLDHDHASRTFRAILCNCCNSAIGYAKENPEILLKMIDYLRRHKLSVVAVAA